jgi:hypothetical protein
MKACRLVRRLSTLILLAALFLPLSRCSEQTGGSAPDAAAADAAKPAQEPSTAASYKYYYAWTDFDASEPWSWLIFVAFLWPLPFLAHELLARGRAVPVWVNAIQIPLGAGSITLVYYRTFLHELWIGGYLAYIALGAFSLALAVEIILGILRQARSRPAARPPAAGP